MQRHNVASINGDVNGSECAFSDSSQQIFRRWFAAARRLVATVPQHLADVVARAGARGVAVARLADFTLGEAVRDGLVLGFGGISGDAIDEGLARLATAFTAASR